MRRREKVEEASDMVPNSYTLAWGEDWKNHPTRKVKDTSSHTCNAHAQVGL